MPAAVHPDDGKQMTVTVMIGIDPHKGSHTAVVIDDGEVELAEVQVLAGRRQTAQLLEWAAIMCCPIATFPCRRDPSSAPSLAAVARAIPARFQDGRMG